MKIQVNAKYKNDAKVGAIKITKIVGNKPLEYVLDLFENSYIHLPKNKFASIHAAISHASLYGFIPQNWSIEETDT